MSNVDDLAWMARAVQLAEQGLYTTDPNPRVGSLLVRDGQCVGQGFHARAGQPHAERHALCDAGDAARGATCYVTLEPCSHTGRTGPCADALVAAGVARVVVAMEDPNPLVAGQGIARLRQAGIAVTVGVLEQQARALNPGFIRRMTEQRPFIRIKLAASVDGRTAMASGESQWITGPAAREDVQRLRARSSAVITGVATVLADKPAYTVRPQHWQGQPYPDLDGWVRQPLRVILDSDLRTPPDASVVTGPGQCLLVSAPTANDARRQRLENAGAAVCALARTEQGLDLHALVAELARRECNELLVECGPRLAGAFVAAALFDQLLVYMAPTLLGSDARPLLALPGIETMAQQRRLRWQDIRQIGDDLRLTLAPC